MSDAALSKVWSFFALAALTLSVLFSLRAAGSSPPVEPFGFMSYKPIHVAVLAVWSILIPLSFTLWLTREWGKNAGGLTWAHRVPIFYFESKDIDVRTRSGKVYQFWAVVLGIVLPFALTVFMYHRFLHGAVFRTTKILGVNTPEQVVESWVQHFDFARLNAMSEQLNFGDATGPQYFAWQPWIFGVWLAAVAIWWAVTLTSIFWRLAVQPTSYAGSRSLADEPVD